MFKKKFWITTSILFVALVVLGPAVNRTLHLASSADGLLLIAALSDESFELNPWSRNCYLIRQDTAVSILGNFDWPYGRRSALIWGEEPAPLIHQAVNYRGLSGGPEIGPYGSDVDKRMMTLLKLFVGRGYSVDEPWHGYAPIHDAIFSGDDAVVAYLVSQGADLDAVIHNPGKKNDGMNSFEFVDWLIAKRPKYFQSVHEIVMTSRNE